MANLLHRLNHQAKETSALILLYHRIAQDEVDPWSLCVSPANFTKHLRILQNKFNPISLTQLLDGLRAGDVPRRSVVVTFDDGYADNFNCAKPLLEQFNVPATFFIASGYIGQPRGFWWDELAHAVLMPPSLPTLLRVKVGNRVMEWGFTQPKERDCCYHAIYNLLRAEPDACRYLNLDAIFGLRGRLPRTSYCRPMTEAELMSVAQSSLIEVGAHTVSHPVLSNLSSNDQTREIAESKAALEKLIGKPVRAFAYPYGTPDTFSDATKQLVGESGFDAACASVGGRVDCRSERMALPRLPIKDIDGGSFEELLNAEFNR